MGKQKEARSLLEEALQGRRKILLATATRIH